MAVLLLLLFQAVFGTILLQKQDLFEFEILQTLTHDSSSFTEGLFIQNGILYESTGLWGQSKMIARQLSNMQTLQTRDLPSSDFGEGIALVGGVITQLTYRGGNVYRYAANNFQRRSLTKLPNLDLIKEGWGATTDESTTIYVSDGSSVIYKLDPRTLRITGSISVRYRGFPISNINELELVNGQIYANIFMTNCAIKIDSKTGEVSEWIRTSPNMYQTANPGVDVFNGIAYDHGSSKLYVTGKKWPHLYQVSVVSARATSNSDLDTFCVHRSMSLADFSVMVTVMHEVPESSLMPGLETTSSPSADQIREYFQRHQSYFQLPSTSSALVDIVASGDEIDKVLQLEFEESLKPLPRSLVL